MPKPGPEPTLREATPEDSRVIWEWRNDETTRAVSGKKAIVPWEGHEVWFASALADPKRHLLIASHGGQQVGVVRLDKQTTGDWLVSINLAPAARGRGLGTPTLVAGCAWLETVVGESRVIADIRRENALSIRIFKSAGFRATNGGSEWLRYEKVIHRGRQ